MKGPDITHPRILREFSSQLLRPVSPTVAAEELKLSVSQLVKTAKRLGIKSLTKGDRSRWMLTHLDIRKIHTYLVARDQHYNEDDSVELANRISDIVQSIYDFPATVHYDIQVDEVCLAKGFKLSAGEIASINKKAKIATETWNLLNKFEVLIGVGGRISLITNYLKDEVKAGHVIIRVTPRVEDRNENLLDQIEDLKHKIYSLDKNRMV